MARPMFLAVACANNLISKGQAWEVYRIQQNHLLNKFDQPKVGHIAQELGILTREKVQQVLDAMEEANQTRQNVEDPLARPPKSPGLAYLTIRVRALVGLVLLSILALVWLISDGSWTAVAAAATILSTLWVVLEAILPKLLLGSFAWNRALQTSFFLLVPLSFAYSLWSIDRLSDFAILANPDQGLGLFARAWTSGSIMALACLFFMVLAFWRHREIWHLESRVDYMTGLVSRTCLKIAAWGGGDVTREEKDEFGSELMRSTAYMMSLNPWLRFVSGVAFWRKGIAATSIWYLLPDQDRQRFSIHLYESPRSPDDVLKAFEILKERHHPVMIDEMWLGRACDSCRDQNKRFDPKKFMNFSDRSQHISLTGFAYGREQAVSTHALAKCLAFDATFIRTLESLPYYRAVEEWVDFKSVMAIPVFPTADADEHPIGVLMAFRTTENAFLPEDKRALCNLSRLFALVYNA